MISISAKLTGGNIAGLGSGSQILFRRQQMYALGQFAIKTVRARVARGIGSDDSRMPRLSGKSSPIKRDGKFVRQRIGYAGYKATHGLQPIRDLAGTGKDGGHMLDNLSVRLASETMVRMSFTQRKARAKALSNEKKAPWLSFSASDQKAILAYAAQMFHAQVEAIAAKLGLKRAA